MKTLHISKSLALRPDYVTQTGAIIARKRRGKTYTASVMAEEMVKAGLPFAAIDPTGAWWGLRASADGKKAGLAVTIIGGEHGDIPLEKTAGKVIADLVVDHPGHYVLDVSDLEPEDMHLFCAEFGERLFKRKKTKRFPMHIFGDEADVLLPQVPENGVHARTLRAYDKIIRRGGLYGLGFTAITQRPALVSKNSLSQVEVLIVLQLIGAQDRDAVEKWVRTHDTGARAEEFMTSLASLGLGEAWVWSPSWLDIFKRIQVRERETFNSSKTPEVGDRLAEPAVLAAVDLEAIKAKVAATIEKAKANDPEALKAEVAALRRQLAARPAAAPAPAAPKVEIVEKPALRAGELDRLEKLLARAEKHQDKVMAAHREAADLAAKIQTAVHDSRRPLEYIKAKGQPAQRVFPPPARPAAATTHHRYLAPKDERVARALPPADAGGLSAPQQRILAALVFLQSLDVRQPDKYQIALFVGVAPSSGSYANNLGALRTAGLIEYPNPGSVELTPAGLAAAPSVTIPNTSDELHAAVLGRLSKPQQSILGELLAAYPNPVTKELLAEKVGVSAGSGSYANNLGHLRTLGAITYPSAGMARAADMMFIKEA